MGDLGKFGVDGGNRFMVWDKREKEESILNTERRYSFKGTEMNIQELNLKIVSDIESFINAQMNKGYIDIIYLDELSEGLSKIIVAINESKLSINKWVRVSDLFQEVMNKVSGETKIRYLKRKVRSENDQNRTD